NAHLQELLHSLDMAALGGAQNRNRAYACIVDAALGSSLTQQLDALNASVVRGTRERGVLPAVGHRDVGPSLQKHPNHVRVVEAGSPHERCPAGRTRKAAVTHLVVR